MNKSTLWKKRAMLMGLIGTLGLSLTGCQKDENTDKVTIEQNIEENNVILIENINGEWKPYKKIVQISYKVQGLDKTFVIMAGLEKVDENKNLYRCITIPEIYLEETYDKENYIPIYKFISTEGINENFTKTTEIIKVAFKLGGKDKYAFEEIQNMEERATELADEELEEQLGR